jgi:beta-galactosidase GanA
MRFLATLAALLLALPVAAQDRPVPDPGYAGKREFGRIAFDHYSLIIDGKRTVIWAGEMHPFRLPSPDLWRDILQKMKASGFNAVAFYFDWGYHSPKQGVYDFAGIRDIDRLLTMASEEGLYVITRAGPYVNAELTRGGFPTWLVNQRGRARTDDPEYLAAADEWLTQIDAIIARHQLNDGKGTVILHQIENELLLTAPSQQRYMDHLYAKARADGITVPIFTNDIGRNGNWVPRGSGVERTVEGPTDLYAFDGYPGGTCTVQGEVTRDSAAPDWGMYGPGGAKGGASASPHTPGFLAEFGGGWFDYWGSNGGYECNARERGRRYQRVFYGTNLANGITLQSFYIAYGGTSWGWLPAPVVYTSYDYGAAISEDRALRPKAEELKQLGEFIESVPDLAKMEKAEGVAASSPNIQIYHNRNPDTGARLLVVTHKPSNKSSDDSFTVDATLPDGQYRFPMRLNGFDAKWLVAGVNLARQHLVYSTSELQTVLPQGEGDLALFYGRTGEAGETVLRYASAPRVTVLEGTVSSAFDAARGDLKLTYTHGALGRVRIEGGGRPPLLLLIGDEAEGVKFWRRDGLLLRGTAMLRSANLKGGTLAMTGDTAEAGGLEVWQPGALRVTWNGKPVPVARTASGSLVSRSPLAGPVAFTLPDLTTAEWRVSEISPEVQPGYDDSGWKTAGGAPSTATGPTRPPDGQPNLAMDAYGFHTGDVWYRGRFAGGPEARRITIHYGAGGAGMLELWMDGIPVGRDQIPGGLARPITTGVAHFELPAQSQAPGEHVLALMIRNDGHNWDLEADEFHKEARGLISASLDAGVRSFVVPIAWKIQGNRGGEDIADPVRGVANNGGLHGERFGWHLPAFDDHSWEKASVPDFNVATGTRWYRTSFDLAVPSEDDATIGLSIGDPSVPRSADAAYRVLIFVNGWNMGQFIANVGPQRVFPIPEGILNHRGHNTIALAVTSDGLAGDGLEAVKLVQMRLVRGGVPVHQGRPQ